MPMKMSSPVSRSEAIAQSIHRHSAPAIGRYQIIISDPNTEPSDEFVDLLYGVGLVKAQEFFSDTPAS
jgi:hypothetical protein